MKKTQTTCLVMLTTMAVGFSLYFLQSVLLPFVISLFIVIGVRPILEIVQRRLGLPRLFAFLFTFLIGVWLMLAFAFLVWISINDLAKNADAYSTRMRSIITWIVAHVPKSDDEEDPDKKATEEAENIDGSNLEGPDTELPNDDLLSDDSTADDSTADANSTAGTTDVSKSSDSSPPPGNQVTDDSRSKIASAPGDGTTDDENLTDNSDKLDSSDSPTQPGPQSSFPIGETTTPQKLALPPPAFTQPNRTIQTPAQLAEKDASDAIQEFLTWVSSYIQTKMVAVAGSLSSLFSYGVLILIFVFFLLLGDSEVERGQIKTLPETGFLAEIEQQVRKYLIMKTVISLFTGFAFGFALWLFGVPLAIVFGFLAFLLNFIPNIGPLISSVLPVPFLILNSNMSPTAAIVCFLLISSIQFISGNVIETRIMGKSFDVSPIALLLALMFFGLVWGIVGMFLATPIVSIIKIVLQQHESTRPIAAIMAGRLDVLDNYRS